MKKLVTLLLLAALVLMLPASAFAGGIQHGDYTITIFNEENGLPTGEANAIVQDHLGYMWIGSYGGLIRYDGTNFVNQSGNLDSSAIRALFVASDGSLYIGTNDAGAYVMKDNLYTKIELPGDYSFLCVRGFAEGKNGDIYAASTSGVARIVDGKIIPYRFAKLQNEQFLSVAADAFGNIWALSDSGCAYIFDEEKFLGKLTSEDFFEEGSLYALCSNANGSIYAGSTLNEVLRIDFNTYEDPTDKEAHSRTLYSTGDVASINHLNPVEGGTVLVSALNGFGYIGNDGKFHRLDKRSENPISANWGELDGQGNYWLASSNYGIARFSPGCFESCNYNSKLGQYTVNAVTKSDGRFYVGLDTGVRVYDSDWNEVDSPVCSILDGVRVRNVCTDIYGRVWFGTYSSVHGVMSFDPKTGAIRDFGLAQGLNSEKVRVVYPLSDGRIFVGNQSGINIIENGKITESYGSGEGMQTTSVLCAMELDGHIYAGTDGSGIYEITEKGLVNLSYDHGLSQGVVLRMEPDSDGNGNFYVAAGDKLFYYENGSFRELTGMELGSGSIYSIYDVNGYVWLLQNAGIFAAKKENVLLGEDIYTVHYGTNCGLTGTLSANTWNFIDDDGSIYLPTRNGVSRFYFKGIELPMPKIVVNSVTVDDELISQPASLELKRGAQRVTFDVSSLLFSDTVKYKMSYTLEGFDNAVFETTENNVSVSYTNLPGGYYTLKAQLTDLMTGETSDVYAMNIRKEISVTEMPAFWAALVAAGITLIVLFFLAVIRRRNAIAEKRQAELKSIIDQALLTIGSTIDAKDVYTKGHSVRVATYSKEIAKRIGCGKDQQEGIYYMGLLHDIGKIGVPDSVLKKNGKLTPEELAIIKQHPLTGGEILDRFEALPNISDGARYHHERWDGKGYSMGLAGTDIPLAARIIGLTDSYDAMQSRRIYDAGKNEEYIINELKNGSGTQFDPNLVPYMIQLIEDGFAPLPQTDE